MTLQYFTVALSEEVGFTDQLRQLGILYPIGKAAGLSFRLSPIASRRSGSGFWEHFDPGKVFQLISAEEQSLPRHVIDLSLRRLRRDGIRDAAALLALIRSQIPAQASLIVLDMRQGHRDSLAAFVASDSGLTEHARELQAKFQRLFSPTASATNQEGPRLLAHVRCGDVADLALFPQSAYLAYNQTLNATREVRQNPFVGTRLLIDLIRAHIAPDPLRCDLFTDGYARTRELINHWQAEDEGLPPEDVALLHAAIDIHEQTANTLVATPYIRSVLGEDLKSLCDLLEAAQLAELILITGNQRMLPKFLAQLGARARRPAMVLMETTPDDVAYIRAVGLNEQHATLISLSPHANPVSPVLAYLRHRNQPQKSQRIAALAANQGVGLYCLPELERLSQMLTERGQYADAADVYEWLAELTGQHPSYLQARLGCLRAADHSAVTARQEQRIELAVKKAKTQAADHINALLNLGRRCPAEHALREARRNWGDWQKLTHLEERLVALSEANRGEDCGQRLAPAKDDTLTPEKSGQARLRDKGLIDSLLRLFREFRS